MGSRTVAVLAVLAALLTGYYGLFERDPPVWEPAVGPAFPRLEFADLEEIELLPGILARAAGARADPILLRKRKEGQESRWWIERPPVPAHLPRVESIAWSLVELQRIAAAPASEAPQVFDREGPAVSVRFRTRDGREHRVEVGRDHPEPRLELTYVRVDGERLFLTRKSFQKILNSSLDDLRSRALFPVPRERVVQLEVQGDPRYRKVVRRQGQSGDWRFEFPEPAPASREGIAELIERLNAWTAESFVRDEPGELSPFGLDKPRTRIILTDREAGRIELLIGASVPQKKEVYVKWEDRPFVMTAAAGPLEMLERPAENLYSQFVLQLGAEDVLELSVSGSGPEGSRLFTLRRSPSPAAPARPGAAPLKSAPPTSPEWTVEEAGGARYPGDRDRIQSLIGAFRYLPVKRYIPGQPPPPPLNGLGEPVVRVEILTDIKNRHVLEFARPFSAEEAEQKITYVGVEGEAFIFQVVTGLLGDLTGGGIRFRDRSVPGPDPVEVLEFEIAHRSPAGLRTWTLGRPAETWRLSEEEGLRPGKGLDPSLVVPVLSRLGRKDLRAHWVSGESDLAGREIADDLFRYRIWFTRGGVEKGGVQRLYLGTESRMSGAEGGYWARVDSPELKELPFILERATGDAIINLVAHLRDITVK